MILGIVVVEALLLAAGYLLDLQFLGAAAGLSLLFWILAYRHPDVSWALVFLASPFSIETRIPGGHALYVPTEPMIGLALLAWTLRVLTRGPIRLPHSSLHAPLAVLAATVLLSAALGSAPLLGLKAWIVACGYVAFAYVYCFVTWSGPSRGERLIPWIVGSGAAWGIYGTVRVLLDGVTLRAAYGAARPFFTEHGAYGAYLAMILPLGLLLALERRGSTRVFYVAASLAMALGIVFSFTRAAWVSLAAVLPATAALWASWRRSLRPFALVAALSVLVLVVLWATGAGEGVTRHVGSIAEKGDVSNLERANRWLAAAEMVRDRPWLGVGFAAYPEVYPAYRRKVILTELAYQHMGAHSEVFRMLSESGIVGFVVACWFLAATVILGYRAFHQSADPRARLLSLALLAGLGTYCIHGLFRTYLDLEKVAVPFWATLGSLAALGRGLERARS